jgi:hypothetical protein
MKKYLFLFIVLELCAFASEKEVKYINFPAQIQNHLYVSGDFIYWGAKEAGLTLAVDGILPYGGNPQPDGKLLKIDPDFKMGFKLNLGYTFNHERWDSTLRWTCYKNEKSNKYNQDLYFLWSQAFRSYFGSRNLDIATALNAKWKLDLNLLDFELARASFETKNLKNRLYFGLRGANINQNLNMEINSKSFSHPDQTGINNMIVKSDLIGIGLRAGFDSKYFFVNKFGIYAIGSLSFVYSHFNANVKDVFSKLGTLAVGLPPHDVLVNIKDKFYDDIATSQLALGFIYDTCLYNQKYHFSFQAGWEQNVFFGVNKMNHFLYRSEQGNYYQQNENLFLQGLVLNLGLDF